MNELRLLLRMARWARRPPPLWRIWLWVAVLAVTLGIAGIQRLGYWPDALTQTTRLKP